MMKKQWPVSWSSRRVDWEQSVLKLENEFVCADMAQGRCRELVVVVGRAELKSSTMTALFFIAACLKSKPSVRRLSVWNARKSTNLVSCRGTAMRMPAWMSMVCGPLGGNGGCTSGKQDFPREEGRLHGRMVDDGWTWVRGARWKKDVVQARELAVPAHGQWMRRIVTDKHTGDLVENLWVSPSTCKGKRHKVLRMARDVTVEVDVCAVDEVKEEELLVGKDVTAFRAISARVNFMAVDRPDVQFCSKEASRCMAAPTNKDWDKLNEDRAISSPSWKGRPFIRVARREPNI